MSDAHRTDLLIVFLQEIPQTTPFTPFTSAPLDEPFQWLPPYTMPISDPYHPSHFVGYTRISFLLCRDCELEEELTHVRSLLFFPPHPVPSAQ
ncbi:hypothetical protein Hanom_Chr05g00409881 [Helianthus anomalus]